MFRTLVFYESVAAAANVLLHNVAGLPDQHVTVQGDNIIVPDDTPNLMAIYAHGGGGLAADIAFMTQGRLEAPSLKPYLDVAAFTAFNALLAAQLPVSPTPINNYIGKGINLVPGENIQYTAAEDAAGEAAADGSTELAAVFLGDGNYGLGSLANLPTETVRFVGQAAAVADVWQASAMVFDQALKAGTYAVIGMRFTSPSAVLARLIFSNQGARPGCLGYVTPVTPATTPIENPMFRNGNLGIWGTFSHNNPPQLELICHAADAAATQIGYLDVVRIG